MKQELRLVGITDEQTVCDACGRVELRCTMILADADGIEAGRYGTTCGSRLLGVKYTAQQARNIEAVRRQNVATILRRALAAEKIGDLITAKLNVAEARRFTLVRPDEVRIAERIEATR